MGPLLLTSTLQAQLTASSAVNPMRIHTSAAIAPLPIAMKVRTLSHSRSPPQENNPSLVSFKKELSDLKKDFYNK